MGLHRGTRTARPGDPPNVLTHVASHDIDIVCPRCQRHAVVTPGTATTPGTAAAPGAAATPGTAAAPRTAATPGSGSATTPRVAPRPRRLSCSACGFTAVWPTVFHEQAVWGRPVDPFFGQPLWLTAPCHGGTLWALNRQHLDLLERRANARRHPRWLELAGTALMACLPAPVRPTPRRDTLRAIARLRASLEVAPPGAGTNGWAAAPGRPPWTARAG